MLKRWDTPGTEILFCCWRPQPVQAVEWAEGTPAPYLVIARAFAGMEGTTKRLLKDEVLVELFRAILARCPGAQHPLPCASTFFHILGLMYWGLKPVSGAPWLLPWLIAARA